MDSFEHFMNGLDHIPWFDRLGQVSPRDREVFRIYAWETWPGPEDPGSEVRSTYFRTWYELVFNTDDPTLKTSLSHLWDAINTKVVTVARTKVPYEDSEDAWYGPNAAAWAAGATASLIGCMLYRFGKLPPMERLHSQWTLEYEWSWYREGHWPCMYYWSWGYTALDAVERTGGSRRLIVY